MADPQGPLRRPAGRPLSLRSDANDPKNPLEAGTNQLEFLEFSIDEYREKTIYRGVYGINVYKVRHVIPLPTVTKVPLQVRCVEGVFHFRGENIPLINLADYLCVKEAAVAEKMVIIAEFNNMQVGFIVHGAHNIRRISWKDLRTPPDAQRDSLYRGITGIALIGGTLIRLLDLEEIIATIGLGDSRYDLETIQEMLRAAAARAGTGSAGASPSVPGTTPEQSAGENPVGGKVVMVVDDSVLSRDAVCKVLQAAGYSVIAVKDGQEAWDRINVFLGEARRQGKAVHELLPLAIVDIEMPQMDGFSLTRLIKEHPELKSLKVVLHTSLGGPENIYKGYRIGADEFLVKFNPKLLLELAEKLTSRGS